MDPEPEWSGSKNWLKAQMRIAAPEKARIFLHAKTPGTPVFFMSGNHRFKTGRVEEAGSSHLLIQLNTSNAHQYIWERPENIALEYPRRQLEQGWRQSMSVPATEWSEAERVVDIAKNNGTLDEPIASTLYEFSEEIESSHTSDMIMTVPNYATMLEAPAYRALRMYHFQCKTKHNIPHEMLCELNVQPYKQSWRSFLAHAEETWVMREELDAAEDATKEAVYHDPISGQQEKAQPEKESLTLARSRRTGRSDRPNFPAEISQAAGGRSTGTRTAVGTSLD